MDARDIRTRPALGREPLIRATVRKRRRWPIVLGAVVLVAGIAAAAALARVRWSEAVRARERLERTSAAYLVAWGRGDWEAMRRLVADPPGRFVALHRQAFEALDVQGAAYEPGAVVERGAAAVVPFTARLDLAGLGEWRYRGRLALSRHDESWRVVWGLRTLHPALRPGLRFRRTRTWPTRAPILARDGTPLTIEGQVVTVGVVPGRVESRAAVVRALRRHTEADPARVIAALEAPGVRPDWFVPVISLRMDRYLEVRPQLYPVPGIFFRKERGRILLEEGLGQHVVGRVGAATAEQLEALGHPYVGGDPVGQYGLERAFERRLAGSPSGAVRLVNRRGRTVRVLHEFAGVEPQRVRTTLDVETQVAAERAVASAPAAAALVAIDVETGGIRAVADHPRTGAERGLAGRYPPGSTFKIVTAAALLSHRQGMDARVPCPPDVVVDGKRFRNFEGESLGDATFRDAFAHSCNTTFVHLATRLPPGALLRTARALGFGVRYDLGVPTGTAQYPSPVGRVELAAAAIGQGRVLATPVHMASVAAAVADGAWRPPRLLAGGPKGRARPLPAGVGRSLRALMRAVVAEGTGTAAEVPGAPVAGKTGTAEFGSGDRTHAWFVGFRGNLAFAVVVEEGGVGGRVAAPIAARFLREL